MFLIISVSFKIIGEIDILIRFIFIINIYDREENEKKMNIALILKYSVAWRF